MASPELTKLSIDNTPKPGKLETAQKSLNRARQMQDSLSAKQLAEPTQPVNLPAPVLPTPDTGAGARATAVAGENERIIGRELDSFKQQQELVGQMAALSDQGSLSDMFSDQQRELGIPQNIRQLQDIQLQLADTDTASDLTKVRIAGAAGQTLGQAGREVTQEDRENAVRRSGLAAQAAVLQGNIQTARQTALDAVNIAYKDRQLENQNLIQQIEVLQGQVDNETAQLLEQDKRQYQAELTAIQDVKDNVAQAMSTGAATAEEVALMTDPNATDEQKIATAQSIVSRGAGEMRDLDVQQAKAALESTKASTAASWALANERMRGGETITSPFGEDIVVPTFEEYLAEEGGKAYAMGALTPEQTDTLRQAYDDEVSIMEHATRVASLSPEAQALIADPLILEKTTPTEAGPLLTEIASAGIDTRPITEGRKKTLPTTIVDNIGQGDLAAGNVTKIYEKLKALPGTGPVAGRLAGLNPYDAKRVEIEALIKQTVPGLARGVFKEVGVLTNEDIQNYTSTIANPNATDEQIELMHTNLTDLIDRSRSITLDNFDRAGYNVENFQDTPAPEGDDLDDDEAWEIYQQESSN